MTHGLVSMRQTVINALANNAAEVAPDCGRNVFTHDISTKRQWQAGFAFPPLAKIDNLFKTGLLICQLSFVNDQTRVSLSGFYGVENSIKGNYDEIEFAKKEL